ncbi:MAG TPA: PKD domain-containing protein, partial [Chthonomonadaceae bacterium]|nr:PKD domain-containing protein [Chthonomonadaceae bacterium]
GSGTIAEDNKVLYSGTESLRLVTHGLYQGAGITFMNPVNLGQYVANKSAYLQFALIPPADPNTTTAGGKFGSSGGFPGFPGQGGKGGTLGGPPAGGFPGGPPGGGPGGSPGSSGSFAGFGKNGNGASSTKFQKSHTLEHIRLLMVTTGNKTLEVLLPMNYAVDDNQWKLLNLPVSAIPGLKAEDGQIKEIRLFGDAIGTLYLGKISVVGDASKITVDAQDEKIVNPNVKYRYTVNARGGLTPLQFSWDWDDRDGIQDESQGRAPTHIFRKSGDFKVTVTVTDPYGIKAPAVMKFNVHVP